MDKTTYEYTINVQTPTKGKEIVVLEVTPFHTVGKVKTMLNEVTGIPVSHQRLFRKEFEFANDEETFAVLYVRENSTLRLEQVRDDDDDVTQPPINSLLSAIIRHDDVKQLKELMKDVSPTWTRAMLAATDDIGNNPIHHACLLSHDANKALSIVKYLVLELNDDVSRISTGHPKSSGAQPLHAACLSGHSDVVTFLLDKGAVVDPVAKDGTSPLHLACSRNHSHIVMQLLKRGADPSRSTADGVSVLGITLLAGSEAVLKMLLMSANGHSKTSNFLWKKESILSDILRVLPHTSRPVLTLQCVRMLANECNLFGDLQACKLIEMAVRKCEEEVSTGADQERFHKDVDEFIKDLTLSCASVDELVSNIGIMEGKLNKKKARRKKKGGAQELASDVVEHNVEKEGIVDGDDDGNLETTQMETQMMFHDTDEVTLTNQNPPVDFERMFFDACPLAEIVGLTLSDVLCDSASPQLSAGQLDVLMDFFKNRIMRIVKLQTAMEIEMMNHHEEPSWRRTV